MKLPSRRKGWLLLPVATLLATGTLQAQAPVPASRDSVCRYERCALGIVPAWNGLAVVRGAQRQQVALLHFFLPRDVSQEVAGPDSTLAGAGEARAEGHRAFRLRRAAAGFTDGGAVLVAAAGLSALRAGRVRRQDAVLAGIGGAAFAISVPLQFAADGALSRAVWWFNRRFAP